MSVEVVWPSGSMALLTQLEADRISIGSHGKLYELYRNCSLAVLNAGSLTDNSKELLQNYTDFDINVLRNERGLKIELVNPPASAFVDGVIIETLRKHLYAVLRDIVQLNVYRTDLHTYLATNTDRCDLYDDQFTTNAIFMILRNAGVLKAENLPNIAVCWGGHSISQAEYDYAHKVGYELGLRQIDICTGCGPGIMEAPMRGALLGHAVQRATDKCRLIGLTEPSIIAAEPPNAMVSDLVILPDIEKRLEAFVRLGHCLMVFPGGPGTAEELLFILSIKMHPENRHCPMPLILTGDYASKSYFDALDKFLKICFGNEITRYYQVILGEPAEVAVNVKKALENVKDHRSIVHDSFCYNWTLQIPHELTKPLEATHENMAALDLHRDQEKWKLAANLRAAFSGIVAGNVKEQGIREVAQKGPFVLHGDSDLIEATADLMKDFIDQGRLMLNQENYKPCYTFES